MMILLLFLLLYLFCGKKGTKKAGRNPCLRRRFGRQEKHHDFVRQLADD